MKKIDIINAVRVLSKLPINKVKNDKTKFSLLSDYRELRKVSKAIDEDRDVAVKKFREDFKDEIEVVASLRRHDLPVDAHEGYVTAERDLNKFLDNMLQEEIAVSIPAPVSWEDFVKAVGDTDLSFEEINSLDCIIAKS